MKIQLIAMDLDGTALRKDRDTFSPRLLRALEEAHSRGVGIVPVTGRQFGLLPTALKEAHPWREHVILCNGGQIRSFSSLAALRDLRIPPQALRELLALAADCELPIEFSLDSKLYLTRESLERQLPWEELAFHRDTILANHSRIVPSLDAWCVPEVEKVMLLCIPRELRETVEKRLEAVAVSAVWTSPTGMEITHRDATKDRGLAFLCRQLDIPMSEVMALGDSGNDITMLRAAGWGVAMGNAPDAVKAAADACTESYDADGAAKAIERYVL